MQTLYFSKMHPSAIIPSKRDEDAGYDLYACAEDTLNVKIEPGEIKLINTSIATAFSPDYVLIVKERGSTGIKGMSIRMGVVDSGYRNALQVGINNTSNKTIVITSTLDKVCEYDHVIYYPASKAIAQALLIQLAPVKAEEISYDDLKEIRSERMTGLLDSTGK
jgi:dUTP pyrophosphatase